MKNGKLDTIVKNDMDLDIYRNIFSQSKRLRAEFEKYREYFFNIESFSEDLYIILFKTKIDYIKTDELDIHSRLNSLILKEIDRNYETVFLKKKTNLKYFNSLLATEILLSQIYTVFLSLKTDLNLKENIEKLNDSKEKEDIKNLDNLIEKIYKSLEESNFFYKIITRGYREFVKLSNTINTWGLNDGKLNVASYDEKVVVSNKLKKLKKVRNMADMTGRFKASASKLQKKKTLEDGMEISGVTLGNNISRVLSSEKMYLTNSKTKKSFFKRYNQKELLSYRLKNNRIQSKGPIICCVDTSSSMEGDLEIWSKSIALTLLDIAFKQKRDFVAILFSYKVGQVIHFNNRKIEANKIYDLANNFFGSGTNFIEPLNESIKLIESSKYKYSDIIFITDGEAPLDSEFIESFIEKKEKKDFRMITVNVSEKKEEELDKINDIQILLTDLTDESVEETNKTIFSI